METLTHFIYASRATHALTPREIAELLAVARRNNAQRGITGMLLYVDRSFFQVLEGDEAVVDLTFRAISADARHSRITRIIAEPIAHRSFAEWTMGFSAVSLHDLGELTGENDFFTDASCLERLDGGRAKKLLTTFRNGGWRPDETGVFEYHKDSAA
jgi:hypothetical protein